MDSASNMDTLPKRITRRNSFSNTPEKPPLKIKEIEESDSGTPSTRTRNRSLSITGNNYTPKKLIKKLPKLSIIPEEDVKNKEIEQKTGKRTVEKSSKHEKSESPSLKLRTRKSGRNILQKILLSEQEYNSDNIETINLIDTSEEDLSDNDKEVNCKDDVDGNPKNENETVELLENSTMPGYSHLAKERVATAKVSYPLVIVEDREEMEISPNKKEANNSTLNISNTPKSCLATDDQNKSTHSKSATFKNSALAQDLKTSSLKTPAIPKKSLVRTRALDLEQEDDVFKEEKIDHKLNKDIETEPNNSPVRSASVKTPSPNKLTRSGEDVSEVLLSETEPSVNNNATENNALKFFDDSFQKVDEGLPTKVTKASDTSLTPEKCDALSDSSRIVMENSSIELNQENSDESALKNRSLNCSMYTGKELKVRLRDCNLENFEKSLKDNRTPLSDSSRIVMENSSIELNQENSDETALKNRSLNCSTYNGKGLENSLNVLNQENSKETFIKNPSLICSINLEKFAKNSNEFSQLNSKKNVQINPSPEKEASVSSSNINQVSERAMTEMSAEYSDDDDHINECHDNSLENFENNRKPYNRLNKIASDTKADENAFNMEVTHMIDETMPNEESINREQKNERKNKKKSHSLQKALQLDDSDTENDEFETSTDVFPCTKTEKPLKKECFKALEKEFMVQEVEEIENEKKEKSRRSKSVTTLENNKVRSDLEIIVETHKEDNIEKIRRSRKENDAEIYVENCVETRKEGRLKTIRKKEADGTETVGEKITETYKEEKLNLRRSRNASLIKAEEAEIDEQKCIETQNEEKLRKFRQSQNAKINIENEAETEIEIDEDNITETHKEESLEKLGRSRNASIIETDEIEIQPDQDNNAEPLEKEKVQQMRRSRTSTIIEVNKGETDTESEEYNSAETEKEERFEKFQISSNDSMIESNEDDSEIENNSAEIIQEEKLEKFRRSRNASMEEKDVLVTGQEVTIKTQNEEKLEKSSRSSKTILVDAGVKEKTINLLHQRSTSLIETGTEQTTPVNFIRRKHSVNFNQQRDLIGFGESTHNGAVTNNATKRIKLSFEESSYGKTMKVQVQNTSTPFIRKKGNEQDASKVIECPNVNLENVAKAKKIVNDFNKILEPCRKNSKQAEPPKEKKKKIKSKISVEEDQAPSSSSGGDPIKRAALCRAIQASLNILTKKNKKHQCESFKMQNDKNASGSKRLLKQNLASMSSSTEEDSPKRPKKRKRLVSDNFGDKSVTGDIVETPLGVPMSQAKETKVVEVIRTASGEVFVEPITPASKKGNIKSPTSSLVEKKRNRHLAATIVKPTNTPTWTKNAGTFKIEKIQ